MADLPPRRTRRAAKVGIVEVQKKTFIQDANLFEDFASDPAEHGRFDIVMAHAFLDIVDLGPSLHALIGLARPGGLLYFPITFDGETIFEPAHPSDQEVLDRYHESIGRGGRGGGGGDSKTGRQLFHALAGHPVDVLEIGSSDWIVHPTDGG